jgi:GAF domain-containing protein
MTDRPVSGSPTASSGSELDIWRGRIVQAILYAALVLGGIALVPALLHLQIQSLMPLYVGIYGAVVIVTFWRRVPLIVRSIIILVLLYALGCLGLFEDGLSGDGRVFLLLLPIVGVMLLGRWAGVSTLVVSVLTLGGFAWAFAAGRLAISQEATYSSDPMAWLSGTGVYLLLGTLGVISLDYLTRRFSSSVIESRRLVDELATAETMARERADRLEGARDQLSARARALEVTAEVARGASLMLDVHAHAQRGVQLVGERLDFEQVGIYLVDDSGNWAALEAMSEAQDSMSPGQLGRLRIGEGVVGVSILQSEARVVVAGESASRSGALGDLPQDWTELAVPMSVRGDVIGALYVRQGTADTRRSEGTAVLRTLADQFAVTVSNARLYQELQDRAVEMSRTYGRLSEDVWRELLRSSGQVRERYDPEGILDGKDDLSEDLAQAVRAGEMVVGKGTSAEALAVPIKTRGDQVIGVIDARKPAGQGEWTPEERGLLQDLVNQLGVALDGAQLYQDSQQRAERERVVGEITARMRETLSIDGVLQAAIREIGEALGIAEVEVRMRGEDMEQSTSMSLVSKEE